MHRQPPLSFFFFLNDRATTEISPLPLHAALPIFAIRQLEARLRPTPGVQSATAANPFPLTGGFSPIRWGTEEALADASKYKAVDPLIVLPDRKSTRLNSSHSQISYAVFCLKKKTCGPRMVCTSPALVIVLISLKMFCSVMP